MRTVRVTRNYYGQEGDVRVGTVLSVSQSRAEYLVENHLAETVSDEPAAAMAIETVPEPLSGMDPLVEVTANRMTFGRPRRRRTESEP